jgi:hypothetical protein
MLRVVLAIKPPHLAEEEKFIQELQTKGSPNFHKFLTLEEWNKRFAPSVEDEQKVVDWAKSQGLTVTKRYSHRLIVDLEAPAGTLEKVFGVTINNYQVNDEVDFSNDRDPVIPASLEGLVYSVQGLNSIQRDHGARAESNLIKGEDYIAGPVHALGGEGHKDGDPSKIPAKLKEENGVSPNVTNSWLDPDDLYSSQIYNFNGLQALGHCCNPAHISTGSPKETSIAIAGFGQFLQSDLVGFQANNTYLAYHDYYYFIDGTPFCNPTNCATGETTEDVEYSVAMSNSFGSYEDTATVYAYLGGNGNNSTYTDIYSDMLNDDTARIMTTSWSCTENYGCSTSTMDSRHSIFNSMVGVGWTLIAASGDRGATDDCTHTSIAYPASDYDVLAAGGTSLQVYYPPLQWDYENGWQGGTYAGACGQNNGGSGGGVSTYYGKPSWQSTYGGSNRLTPDLSLNALGVGQNMYINGIYGGGSANGTSVVAPELSGFFAQENSYLLAIGNRCGSGTSACAPIGNPMPFIYEEGIYHNAAHVPYYDITSGCNSNDITAASGLTYYCAHSAYDLVTGWGSANMMQLAWALNWEVTTANGVPSTSFSGPTINHWYNTDQVIAWSIIDNSGISGVSGTGIAGFTQGWDSIPSDSTTAAHGGANVDTFFAGPQYANASGGCLSFNGGSGCAGGSGQGCHTAHVRGWNNQGETTGDTTYGPICYDTVVPTITVSNSPVAPSSGWYNGTVNVTLTASDPGGGNASGIAATYYAVNQYCNPSTLAGCSIYSSPVAIATEGYNYIYYFTRDIAGNASSLTYEYVDIDLTAPATTSALTGTFNSTVYTSAVGVTLSASDNLSGVVHTYYALDGGATTIYSAALNVSALGAHSVKYWSVDNAGNTEAAHTVSFTIDSLTTSALTASANPIVLGQSVTLTATVTASLSGTPTGSVIFYNGATNLGTGTLSGGVATLTTSALPAGFLTLQAAYQGGGNFLASNSFPYDETVHENTTTSISSTLNPSIYGQSITFTVQVAPSASGIPTGTVQLNGFGTKTLTLNGSGVATYTTSLLVAGNYSVTATYGGDSTYLTSTSSTLPQTVNQASQTINWPAVGANQNAGTPFSLAATASSGLAVSFTSLTPTVCSVSGTTASPLIAGTCTIQATQAGNVDYAAATPVNQSVLVHHIYQTITFPTIPSQPAATSLTLSASSNSGLPITFSSTTPTVCSVSGTTASLHIAGTCTVEASQAGNGEYNPANVSQSFSVTLAAQSITWPAIGTDQNPLTSFHLGATASSGLTVAFASTTPTVCSVSGTTASMLTSGTCTIQATQAGNTTYAAATPVSQSTLVHHLVQTINWPAIGTDQYAGTSFHLGATASSGLTVTFASTTPTICSVSGTTANMLISGTCTIQATQAGNSTYAAATPVSQSTLVHHASQTITFPTIPAQTSGTNLALTATSSSGLAVSFASTTTSVCTVSGTTASLLISGTCTIQASQAGNGEYNPATTVSQSFTVN